MIAANVVDVANDTPRPDPGVAVHISLFTGMVSAAIIYDALPPILPALSAEFGGGERGDLIAQLAMTIPLLGMAVSGLIAGTAIEKFGVKKVLLAAIICFAVAGSSGAMIHTSAPLFVVRFLAGLASGTLITCGTSLIAGNFMQSAQLHKTGRLYAVGAICSIGFVVVAGFLATISWRLPFFLHAFIAILFLIPVILLPKNADGVKFGFKDDQKTLGFFKRLLVLKPARRAFLLITLLNFLSYLFSVEFVFLLSSVGVTSPIIIANGVMVYAAAALAGNLLITRVDARIGIMNTILAGLSLIAISFLICATAPNFWLLILGPLVGGLGTGLSIPSTIALIMRSIPTELAARALSFGTAMMYLGGGVAPILLAPVRSALGLRGVYYFSATLILVVMLPSLVPLFNRCWQTFRLRDSTPK